jgi:hypothetical protein
VRVCRWELGLNWGRRRTDAEAEEGQQRDGVAAEAPAEGAGGGRLLGRLHGVWRYRLWWRKS